MHHRVYEKLQSRLDGAVTMAVFRKHKNKDFTVMCNHHLRDKKLSLKAKGLLSEMLSNDDDWEYSISSLASMNKEGKDAIQAALKELEESGYLVRTRTTDEQGRFDCIYDVYEVPPEAGLPQPENRDGKSVTENPPLRNTNIRNTKEELLSNKKDKDIVELALDRPEKNQNSEAIAEIIDYLNMRTGRRFKATNRSTARLINARLNDGYTVEDFKEVIDKKCVEWMEDPHMQGYLRPETLFTPAHFESYLNQSVSQKKGQGLAF